MNKIKNFLKKIADAIIDTENKFSGQPKTGEIKKQRVLLIISNLVSIPFIPDFLMKKILDLLIDIIVYIFNEYNLFNKN